MSEASAIVWPLDFDALRKGDVIEVERVAKIVGASYGTMAFGIGLLQLETQILKRTGLRIVSRKGSVHVLTDAEYASDTSSRVRRATTAIVRAAHLPEPELAALTAEQRADWDRSDYRAQRHSVGVLQAEKKLRAEERALRAGTQRSVAIVREREKV